MQKFNNFINGACIYAQIKGTQAKSWLTSKKSKRGALTMIEIIMILIVVVILAVIFQKLMNGTMNTMAGKVNAKIDSLFNGEASTKYVTPTS